MDVMPENAKIMLERKLRAIQPPTNYSGKLNNDKEIRQIEEDINVCNMLLNLRPKYEKLLKRLSE